MESVLNPAGAMRYRIRFENPAAAVNDPMGRDVDWSEVVTTRASMRVLGGSEGKSAQGEIGKVQVEFKVHWQSALAAVDNRSRIVNARTGEIYDIVSPVDVGEQRQFVAFRAVQQSNE